MPNLIEELNRLRYTLTNASIGFYVSSATYRVPLQPVSENDMEVTVDQQGNTNLFIVPKQPFNPENNLMLDLCGVYLHVTRFNGYDFSGVQPILDVDLEGKHIGMDRDLYKEGMKKEERELSRILRQIAQNLSYEFRMDELSI